MGKHGKIIYNICNSGFSMARLPGEALTSFNRQADEPQCWDNPAAGMRCSGEHVLKSPMWSLVPKPGPDLWWFLVYGMMGWLFEWNLVGPIPPSTDLSFQFMLCGHVSGCCSLQDTVQIPVSVTCCFTGKMSIDTDVSDNDTAIAAANDSLTSKYPAGDPSERTSLAKV